MCGTGCPDGHSPAGKLLLLKDKANPSECTPDAIVNLACPSEQAAVVSTYPPVLSAMGSPSKFQVTTLGGWRALVDERDRTFTLRVVRVTA